MCRPSAQFAVIIVRVCFVGIFLLIGAWYFLPVLQSYRWITQAIFGIAIFMGLMGAWHDGYAMPDKQKREGGNVLIFILIAVVLFAGLTAVMNQGGRTSTGMLTEQQARLVATEIISYGDSIAQAVQRLQLNGCSEQEIDFSGHNETSKRANGESVEYNNPHKRSDGSCGVFHANGGAITPALLSSGYIDPSLVNVNWLHPQGIWLAQHAVQGVGSDGLNGTGTDLVLYIGRLQKGVCLAINNMLDVENPFGNPPVATVTNVGGELYIGTFSPVPVLMGHDSPAIRGKTAFCGQGMSSTAGAEQYIFFRVLIAR